MSFQTESIHRALTARLCTGKNVEPLKEALVGADVNAVDAKKGLVALFSSRSLNWAAGRLCSMLRLSDALPPLQHCCKLVLCFRTGLC